MAFDATVGGADANSYVDLAYADDYISTRLSADEWDAATDAVKESALVTATQTIEEAFSWRGEKATDAQALHWPAKNAVDCFGNDIDDATIPAAVKKAVCEQALYLLKFDATQTPTSIMQGLKSAKVGSLAAEFDLAFTPAKAQTRVQSILRCYGEPIVNINGGSGINNGYAIR